MLSFQSVSYHYPHSTAGIFNLSFQIPTNHTLVLVGASGSGKTTIAHLMTSLSQPSSGKIFWKQQPLATLPYYERQLVFQNPHTALNPRFSPIEAIFEAIHHLPGDLRLLYAEEWLEKMGIARSLWHHPLATLSGGQKQRVSIARAFAGRPALLVCDEPVSALDLSEQGHVLNALKNARDSSEAMLLVIVTHDLLLARQFADSIIVLKDGIIQEHTGTDIFFQSPQSAYGQKLLEYF